MTRWLAGTFALALVLWASAPTAQAPIETPDLAPAVAEGRLPPVAQRLPARPLVTAVDAPLSAGRHGGELRTIVARARDVRLMVVWGYARLLGYLPDLSLAPDIAEAVEVEGGRVFTFRLRPGHRWSDGHPFTTEDFRYYWEDVANDPQLSPTGPPAALLVDGRKPEVTFPDAHTVRYAWHAPNPLFLTELAGAAPLYIFRPSHYLKQFHRKYADADQLAQRQRERRARTWSQLHNRVDNQYRNDNPELPTLDPWVNRTAAPAERFVFTRNPYYHRVDPEGRQLPYIDRIVLQVAEARIVPVKTGAGESDLQGRYINFDNYTFLKQSAARNDYRVDLWTPGKAAHLAMFPNLTAADPTWRELMRDVRFRRALSLGVNRREINRVVFYGLGREGNHTVLEQSPLFDQANRDAWAAYDPKRANAMLDEIGLTDRDIAGYRRLPDGRPLTLVVEAAGDSFERTDVLQLVRDSWRGLGVKLLVKATQSELFRNRVFSGEVVMSISSGADIGLATADMAPWEWAPTNQQLLQWSQWGNHFETAGKAGQEPDLPEARRLLDLFRAWTVAGDVTERTRIWREMLRVNADQVFAIGLIAAVPQPVVVSGRLRNLPREGLWGWDPGGQFGMYRLDRAWLAEPGDIAQATR